MKLSYAKTAIKSVILKRQRWQELLHAPTKHLLYSACDKMRLVAIRCHGVNVDYHLIAKLCDVAPYFFPNTTKKVVIWKPDGPRNMLRPLRFLVTAVPPRISLKTEIAAADDSNHHHNRKLCCNFHSPGRGMLPDLLRSNPDPVQTGLLEVCENSTKFPFWALCSTCRGEQSVPGASSPRSANTLLGEGSHPRC